MLLLCADGAQEYEYGPSAPPLAATVADPRVAQVMEEVLKDKEGTGLKLMKLVALAEQPEAAPTTVYPVGLSGVKVSGLTAKLPGNHV